VLSVHGLVLSVHGLVLSVHGLVLSVHGLVLSVHGLWSCIRRIRCNDANFEWSLTELNKRRKFIEFASSAAATGCCKQSRKLLQNKSLVD
jgi:hypothetical protein